MPKDLSKEEIGFGNKLQRLEEEAQRIEIQKQIELKKAISSDDADSILKAQTYFYDQVKKEQGDDGSKSILVDPMHTYTKNGYVEKNFSLSYDVLRNMSRTPIPRSIIGTRKEQVAEFSTPQRDKYSPGFVIKRKSNNYYGYEEEEEISKQEISEINELTSFVLNCGSDKSKWYGDDFEMFLRKIVQDSLSFDQYTFEVVRSRSGKIVKFFATDASTFRIADTYDDDVLDSEATKDVEKINGYYPSYVQVYHARIMADFYPWELCFGVRNPSTDLLRSAYGRSELEDLISTVTNLLNADKYNANYFKIGSNPKGLLRVKNLNSSRLDEFRRQWMSEMAGVENCLSGETFILTKEFGGDTIENILEGAKDHDITIWTGEKWEKANVYVTGNKKICETKIGNGVILKTSPDHKIKVINQEGIPEWKVQSDLKEGDFVMVNKESSSFDFELNFKGKEVEGDLLEILGWMIGDGWIGANVPKKRRVELFYHQEKEIDISQRHLKVLKKYGINHSFIKTKRTENQIKDIKNRYGFKNVADHTIKISIIDFYFHQWLIDLGFKTSSEGKNIPSLFYVLSESKKGSFLKGLFSADGNNYSGTNPAITISDNNLRMSVKQLLLSIGIRANIHEGKVKETFNVKSEGYRLLVKDRAEYFNKVGFLQDHKQPDGDFKYSLNTLPRETAVRFLKEVRDNSDYRNKLSERDIKNINSIVSEKKKSSCSYNNLIYYLEKAEYAIPSWLINYNFEKIIKIERLDNTEFMYDIEVYDEVHQFIANGIVTHNSHKMPIMDADKMEFISTQQSNKDMEYGKYYEFLVKIACAIYTISPEEIGFPVEGMNSNKLGSGDNKTELEYSRSKGLFPLLRHIEKNINKYIIEPASKGKYEFVFVGLNERNAEAELEMQVKEVQYIKTVNEIRKARGDDEIEGGDVILNPVFMQGKQMNMMGGEESNDFMDQLDLDADAEKSESPMVDSLQNFIDEELS